MTKIAVRRPVTTLMVILIFIAFGFMSLMNLKMDLLPNMDIPIAAVYTTYVGASPEQIQNLVTKPVEGAMATVDGLDTMLSTTSENVSIIIMQFEQGVDIDMTSIDIREKIDLMKNSLPEDAGTPTVMKFDVNSMSGIYVSVSSEKDDLVELKNKVDDQISDRLLRQAGVASVSVSGGREREIRVDLIEDRIRGYGIAESTVAGLLALENSSLPIGSITEAGRNLTIKVDGEFTDVSELSDIPIPTATGSTVYLRDIAEITEEYKDISSYSYLNGTPSVNLTIQKQSNANTVNVSNAVMKEIDKIRADFPDLEIKVIMDPADYINDSLSSVVNTAISGVILAVIVLFVFLRNVRSTLVVGAAIPLSVMVTFSFMYFANMTLNLMSLGGLTLGVGMLVDNSIVVLESIFRRMEEGEGKARAAINGAKEVAMSIVASTLTTVAVFVPVAWLGGMIAQIFNDLALSITFSLAASLLVSLTFVPLACALFLSPAMKPKHPNVVTNAIQFLLDGIGKGIDGLVKAYGKALVWATRHRKTVVFIAFLFFVGTMSLVIRVGMELLPGADQSQISISVSLPSGAVLERTSEITEQVLAKLDGVEEIADISTTVGSSGLLGGGSNSASITVALYGMSERERTSTEIADEIRTSMQDIAGAEISVEAQTSLMSMSVGAGGGEVQYNIKGEDIEDLQEVANELTELMASIPGLRDVSNSMADTTPQATIKIDRLKASSVGLSASTIMGIVNTTVSGSTATTFREGATEIDIRVGQENNRIQNLEDIENLLIPTNYGTTVPLREVAQVTVTESPQSISRLNQSTYVSVYGSLDGSRYLDEVTNEFMARVTSEYIFPMGVELEVAGNQATMDEELYSLLLAFVISIFVVYAIMAAEFESLYYPMIIMLAVPVAISTGVMGLFVMGQTINLTSALGFIMLLGIVINNGIVLIDYINLQRGKGMDLMTAVQTAGPVRLRAILMATLTTVLGLVPMMLGAQEGSEMMQPLATVVVWGLALSTMVTLFVVPVIYIMFENVRGKLTRGKEKKFRQIEEI